MLERLTVSEGVARPRRRLDPVPPPAQRSALKLQGKYMDTMRGLKAANRAIVKRVRVPKGIHGAIAEAKRLTA